MHPQAEAAATQVLERLEAAHAQYASQRSALAAQLDDLEKRVADTHAAAEAAQAARDAAVAGLGSEGLDEAAVRVRLAAAAADSRMQEAAIAAQEARPATAGRMPAVMQSTAACVALQVCCVMQRVPAGMHSWRPLDSKKHSASPASPCLGN